MRLLLKSDFNEWRPIMFLKTVGMASSLLLCSNVIAMSQPVVEELFTAN